jgi:hypothetical protein
LDAQNARDWRLAYGFFCEPEVTVPSSAMNNFGFLPGSWNEIS